MRFLGRKLIWAAALSTVLSPLSGQPVKPYARVTPEAVTVGQPTLVTFTVEPDTAPTLIGESINLLRLTPTGGVQGNLGRMYDDGTHGDQTAGDGVFTLALTINEPQPAVIGFQVSAAYRGLATRVFSNAVGIRVFPGVNPEQTLSQLAAELEAGNMAAAAARFTPTRRNTEALQAMSPAFRAVFAGALRGARLVKATEWIRTYELQWPSPGGSTAPEALTLVRAQAGSWLVDLW